MGREGRIATEDVLVRKLGLLAGGRDAATGSLLRPAQRRSGRDPFTGSLAARLDDRSELAAAFQVLHERERLLLYLWYIEDRPVEEIAARLGVSRGHCYRLRASALAALTSDPTARAEAEAEAEAS